MSGWRLERTYASLPDLFHTPAAPTPVHDPRLVLLNRSLAGELGLDPTALDGDAGAAIFAGNVLPPVLPEYLSASESTGFTFTAGGGMDYRINSVLQLRLARLEYRRSWLAPLNGYDFSRGLQFSTGLMLQFGTW